MNSILVLCEGNICRSPMAAGILAAALPGARVESAGLAALIGMPADETAIRLLTGRGIDIRPHRAVQVTRELCQRAELVLVMSTLQRQEVERQYPTTCGRVFRIGEFDKRDIPDPYRKPEMAFRDALELIEAGSRAWLQRIRRI
jgi:protein-tyrosine phosphatase